MLELRMQESQLQGKPHFFPVSVLLLLLLSSLSSPARYFGSVVFQWENRSLLALTQRRIALIWSLNSIPVLISSSYFTATS